MSTTPRFVRLVEGVATALGFAWLLDATPTLAAVYGGQGILAGISAAAGLGGISTSTSIRDLIIRLILFVLNFVLLLAVVAIIIAGIYLIVSNGDEGQKDKAKNIILYALIGIVVILFSRLIVTFVNNLFSS
jgi:hypothetical protein